MPNIKLIIFVGLLVCGAAITLMLDKKGNPKESAIVGEAIFAMEKVAKIDKIIVKDGEEALKIQKMANSSWVLPDDSNFPAKAQKVVSFFENLSEIKVIRQVSQNKDAWPRLELDKGKQIELSGPDYNYKIIIGKGRDSGGQFIARNEKPDSILIDPEINLDTKKDNWWYKTLIKIENPEVKSVEFKDGFVLKREKKEDELQLEGLKTDKESLKESESKRLKSLVEEVSFTSKSARTAPYNNALKKAPTIIVKSFSNHSYNIKIVALENIKEVDGKKEKETKYYFNLKTDDPQYTDMGKLMDTWQFEISEYVANNFLRKRSDFVEKRAS